MVLKDDSRSPHGERGLKCNITLAIANVNRRSPHGERGLKSGKARVSDEAWGRSPHGERGLKLPATAFQPEICPSLPAWGAWIEIRVFYIGWPTGICRSPHGERGLKFWRQRKGL